MDAFEEQPWQANELRKRNLLYLYCVDLSYEFGFTVPSLPFLKLNGVFGHVSFPGSQTERRMVVFPRSDELLAKLKEVVSPCVVEVTSSVNFEIHPEEVEEGLTKQEILIIWNVLINKSLSVTSACSPVRPKMASLPDKMPSMPLLDLNKVSCNCSRFPRKGMVLQSANEAQGAASICVNQLKQMSLSDRDALGHEDDVEDDDDDIEDDELSEEEEAGSSLSSRSDLVEFVPPKTRVSSEETQLFTETFTLKGSSFHEHFQSALKQCKVALKEKEQIPVRFVLEPINRRDENAVIVQVMFHDTWKPIGYIPGIKVPKGL